MRPCPSALRAAGLLWGFFACAAARASPSVCEAPEFRSFGAVELVEHDRSALAGIPASSRLETRDFALGFAHRSGRFAWGITHRYAIFDFAGIEPQTNGHVHTTTLPLHWRSSGNRLRFSAAPALSASSNVMGHPQEWQSETLQLLAALVVTSRISDTLDFRWGICGDHRFGEYAIYPTAALLWSPGRWRVELGFPRFELAFEPGNALRFALSIAPDGNEWHVKDRGLVAGSQLVYEGVAVEWRTEWRVTRRVALSLSLGRQLENRYELALAGGTRLATSGDAVSRVGLGIRSYF